MICLKDLDDSVTIPTSPKSRERVPYFNGVDLDHVQLPEHNDPVLPASTSFFEKPIADL